jgi:hypothetical protein
MGLFDYFSWVLGDEFYWYITRGTGSNQLTNEEMKRVPSLNPFHQINEYLVSN